MSDHTMSDHPDHLADDVDPEPTDNPSVSEIESDIAETRERLASSVDQLAAKLDVKTQAQEKVAETKEKAQEKVHQAQEQVVATSRSLVERFQTASLPAQIAIGAAPLALLVLLIVRRVRSR